MRNQGYNGKTHLLVTYQWNNGANDAIIIDEDFDTLDEAYDKMECALPDCWEADDGYDIDQWTEVMEKGEDDDIFLQFNAQIDDDHNLLAVLRPIR